MRTFLISLALLVATIGLCLWSFFAVSSVTGTLYTLAEQIPVPIAEDDLRTPAVTDAVAALQAEFAESRTLLAIGISERTLAEIARSLVAVEIYALAEDLSAFQAARADLLLSIAHLQHLERTVL